jgi:hypothetical protein
MESSKLDPRFAFAEKPKDEPALDPRFAFAEVTEEEKSYLQKIWNPIQEYPGKGVAINKRWKNDEISAVEADVLMAQEATNAFVLNPIGETLMQGIKSASQVVDWVIPDFIDQPVNNFVREKSAQGITALMGTDAGEKAQKALAGTYKDWLSFKEENPRTADMIEAVVNIGLVFAPTKLKVESSPVVPFRQLPKGGEIEGGALSKALIDSSDKQIEKAIWNQIKPKTTGKMLKDTSIEGAGITAKYVYKPTDFEQSIVTTLRGVEGFKAKEGAFSDHSFWNWKHTEKSVDKLSKKLNHQLKQFDHRKLDPNSIYNEIKVELEKLFKTNEYIAGSPAIQAQMNINLASAKRMLENTAAKSPDGLISPIALLELRRTWDYQILGNAPKTFDDVYHNARSESGSVVRNVFNQEVMKKVPEVGVKESLNKQHLLLSGMSRLEEKAIYAAPTAVGRLWQNASKVIDLKLNANRTLAVLGATGTYYAAQNLGAMYPMAFVGAMSYYVAKKSISPEVKRALGETLKYADRAIKTSTNKDMIKQLKADRAFVYEIYNLPVVKDLEKQTNKEK